MNNDYHDYVIKNGIFIGKFEEMYKDCKNPWPESYEDMEKNCASVRLKQLVSEYNFSKILNLGNGKGNHLHWIIGNKKNIKSTGVEISQTAVNISRKNYPEVSVYCSSILKFLKDHNDEFDLIIMRELIWYILDDIKEIFSLIKKKYFGKYIAIELTFYEDQRYGLSHFKGMEDFINKYIFDIVEIVKIHKSKNNNSEYLMIFSKI